MIPDAYLFLINFNRLASKSVARVGNFCNMTIYVSLPISGIDTYIRILLIGYNKSVLYVSLKDNNMIHIINIS